MLITRRSFAALVAPAVRLAGQMCPNPLTGTATPFSPIAGQMILERKVISAMTAPEVDKLRLAYKKMRDLSTANPNDPHGLSVQANMHCFFCGGNSATDPDIHQSWLFFPWHRAYLYYHERILQKVLNDANFRLPAWDWDVMANRRVPDTHAQQNVAGQPNSLFDSTRIRNGGQTMPSVFFPSGNANPMNAPSFTVFGGTAGAGGNLENGPHGSIHVWLTTNPGQQPKPNMGDINQAARDPIFYSHHCNIDRLWSEWLRRSASHKNPTQTTWRNTQFRFFDENKAIRSIKVSDLLDTAPNTVGKLGYKYTPGAGLSNLPPAKIFDITFDAGSRTIRLPEALRARILNADALNADRALIVEDAVLPKEQQIYYIYAGNPPAGVADLSTAPNFVGIASVFKGPMSTGDRKTALMLSASKRFAELASMPAGTKLVIAPAGSTAGNDLVYQRVYVSER